MSYADYRNRVIAAQDQWDRERDQSQGYPGPVSSAFDGEFEPPAIAAPDNYDSMTLPQLVDAVNAMRPETVRQAAETWQHIADVLSSATQDFHQQFQRAVSGDDGHDGWSGRTAQAATDAVRNYSRHSRHFADAVRLVQLRLVELHTGLERTQSLMPQATPPADSYGKTLPVGGVMKAGDFTQQEETEEARRVLRSVYGQAVARADRGVPVFPAAPALGAGTATGEDSAHG